MHTIRVRFVVCTGSKVFPLISFRPTHWVACTPLITTVVYNMYCLHSATHTSGTQPTHHTVQLQRLHTYTDIPSAYVLMHNAMPRMRNV